MNMSFWSRGWIWTSLVILIAISVWMSLQARGIYQPLRGMLGMVWLINGKPQPVEKARPLAEIKAHSVKSRPLETLIIGVGAFALILWLMIFKPF